MRERARHVCTPQVGSGLQAAWIALVKATPVEALTSAVSKELVGTFFLLGGAPSGQALPPQLMCTQDLSNQVRSAMAYPKATIRHASFCLSKPYGDWAILAVERLRCAACRDGMIQEVGGFPLMRPSFAGPTDALANVSI